MKKAVAILIVFLLMFSIVSCSDGSETTDITSAKITESITEKIIESVTDNELCSVPTVPSDYNVSSNKITVRSDYTSEVKTLYGGDEEFIHNLIADAEWTDGTADCFYDCSINCMGRILYYHSYCGVIADVKNKCSFSLTKNQIHKMNVIISKYEEDSGIATSYSIKSKEGIDLSVNLSENPVKSGEKFVLTATVTNNTGKTIYVTMPTGTPNRHYEIRVKITDGKRYFIDADTQGKEHTDDMGMFMLKNGESYTQEMNMVAGYLLDGSHPLEMNAEPIYGFAADVYEGTATFCWSYEDPWKTIESGQDIINREHTLELDFKVQVK